MDEAVFKAALEAFVAGAQAIVDAGMARYPNITYGKLLTVMMGPRYVRVVVQDVDRETREPIMCGEPPNQYPLGRSCYCFVDRTNGDILKSASWKAPAKGKRGNIFTSKVADAVSEYGAHHAR